MSTAHLTQVDIETDILRICDRLEEDTSLLADISVQRAEGGGR